MGIIVKGAFLVIFYEDTQKQVVSISIVSLNYETLNISGYLTCFAGSLTYLTLDCWRRPR